MAISSDLRAVVRAAFGGRCGYCGVSEESVGGELELDHFHPQAAGGSDDVGNLVYACTACNRFKGDYSASEDAPEGLKLLHPQRDMPHKHMVETGQGRLLGTTPRGWFHIQRLHLNRPQLVEVRRMNHVLRSEREELTRARQAQAQLHETNLALQAEVAHLRALVEALLKREGG